VEAWNQWRRKIVAGRLATDSLDKFDLTSAFLSGMDLRYANFFRVNLSGATLDGANLGGADLRQSTLIGTDLHSAALHTTNLTGSDLSGADLGKVILTGAIFGHTNLTDATGLETYTHLGPSVLDYSTLAQSGMLPPAFLRGCGLPENLITYLPSLLNQAIQFYSCFISYSTKDQDFAGRLHADLQNKGVRCWFAPHDIAGGKKIHEQIDEAIRVYDRLLLILSEHSMTSEWVKTEIANARQREISEKRQMLFPISLAAFDSVRQWKALDADTAKDSAREIREYFIPDFSNWKDHDSYKAAFDRLIRDLAAKKLSASA